MTTSPVQLGALLARGIAIRPHEAVAIVQQLVHAPADVELVPPLGPPTPDRVVLLADGRVGTSGSATAPAVSEIGRLLDALLPRRPGVSVPGGLRYAVARALLEVDAPPFDSLDALSASIRRFESGDRAQVVRALIARARATCPTGPRLVPPPPAVPAAPRLAARFAAPVVFGTSAAAAVLLSFAIGWEAASRVARHPGASPAPDVQEARPIAADDLPPIVPASGESGRDIGSATREPRPAISVAGGDTYSPAFSPDGQTLYFHTGGSRAPTSALMMRRGDAPATAILHDGSRNYHVQPSPDGTRIAFDSDRGGGRAVYVADADGGNVRRVTGGGYAAVPTWSPDGRQLAFVRAEQDRPAVWNLWLATLARAEERRLTRFAYGQTWGASWLPGGRQVCFSHEDRLIVLTLADGRMRTYQGPIRGRPVRTPAVSPDGTRVVFQVWRDGVWLLDLDSGAMRRLLDDATAEEFAWSPDGRRVAYHSREGGRWGIRVMAPSTI